VTAEVDRIMRELARASGAKLLVFKELEDTKGALEQALRQADYIQGDIPPMHLLNRSFQSFAQYRDALRSRYRAQIQRSQKKLMTAGFEALSGRGQAFFDSHWSEDVHRLYVAVQQRAEHKLELMPSSFFTELAQTLADEVSLTLIHREGRVCAFTFAITRERTHYNLYSGLDYALNNEGDLYFNLFYNDLDQAFRSGATSVHLGQTSDSFKSRLGSSAQPLHFFVRGSGAWTNWALRRVASIAFPKLPRMRSRDVFGR
jgi:predicted N-acyltransferase